MGNKSKGSCDELYTIRNDVQCVKCGNKGAVQYYGDYYPQGFSNEYVNEKTKDKSNIASLFYDKYRNAPYMSYAMGFGGTIPHKCLNCGNSGLIDMEGLEGYHKAFVSIKEKDEL